MKILATITILCLISTAVIFGQTRSQQPTETKMNPGRYQLVINPNVRADTFLLDTQTGRIWMPTEYTNLGPIPGMGPKPTVWQFQDRVDNQEELARWIQIKKDELLNTAKRPPVTPDR